MCGISGLCIAFSHHDIDHLSQKLLKTLHHRGPDGNGTWTDNKTILLAHNRLSIQDLSSNGKQPMLSSSNRYVLTFNGEIYNFLELKNRLQKLGHSFIGTSDTEVILASIEEWGIQNSISQFNGMFAFALWDRELETITFARDRLGEKPLFYGWSEKGLMFASELEPFKYHFETLHINQEIINDFLNYGYIPTPHTIYEGIYKLIPGSFIQFNLGQILSRPSDFSPTYSTSNISPKQYWSVRSHFEGSELIKDPDHAVEQLEELLDSAIQRQLIADVSVGTFLSGGIDSSLVTAVAQKNTTRPIKTFTIGFDVDQFNEAIYAKEIASHLGTDHTEVYLTSNDCLNTINRLPGIYGEPFADPSQLPTILVSEIAREQVTVCLSGDGGDELFAGYNRYISTINFLRLTSKLPKRAKHLLANTINFINPNYIDTSYNFLSRMLPNKKHKQANIAIKIQKLGNLLNLSDSGEIYNSLLSLSSTTDNRTFTNTLLKSRIDDFFSHDREFIDIAMLIDQLNYLPDDNLTKVDRASMSCSLETRLPLLDKEIVELSWKIPYTTKIKDNLTKWPLRQILYKHVPKELIDRPKMGFSVPISSWLRNDLKDWSHDLLNMKNSDLGLNNDYWLDLWQQHQSGSTDNGLALWPAIMLNHWYLNTKETAN
ncbi:MAG: asparagine synthase (glutamine-hydrolyzing) [Candidatus Thiodiazotropha sp.]